MKSKAHTEMLKLFRVLVDLEENATIEKHKIPANTLEHLYWQARADNARALAAVFRASFARLESKEGVGIYTKLVKDRTAW
jgi:hypothetical protein